MSAQILRASVALAALALAGASAMAQSPARAPAEIMLTTGEAPVAVTVIGDIRAEAHKKSMFGGTSGRDMVNDELRKQAAKVGADAVVNITYEDNNPLMSKKGYIATGKAVKFQPGATIAAAPAPAPVQTAAAPASAAPTIVASAPAPAPAVTPVAAPAVSSGPTPAALITLTEQDLSGRAYTRLGAVNAEVHQTSMFPKTPTRQLLDDTLRANAAKMGADAVIQVKYNDSNALFSKKGSTAQGIAVKFAAAAAAPAQVAAAPVPPPTPVIAPALAPPPAVVAAAPAPAAAPAAAQRITLTEQNISRAYTVVGPVNSEVNQATAALDKTGREVLDEDLRKQAEKLGADAVIMIKYAPAAPGHGPSAIGVAVKFN